MPQPLPTTLHRRIAEFLASLPNMSDPRVQQALIAASVLDSHLRGQIVYPGASLLFVEALIPTLLDYGRLSDGRYALEAVLETAKNFVGSDREVECEQLLQKFRNTVTTFPPEQIEFVNRDHEITFITGIYSSPYLIVTAPLGYGKTRLLEAVKHNLLKQRCFCLHLRLQGSQTLTCANMLNALLSQLGKPSVDNLSCRKHGTRVGQAILRVIDQPQQHVVILLDDVELLDEPVVGEFLNSALPAIDTVLQQARMPLRLRLIAAGRTLAYQSSLDFTLPINRISLSPFNFSAVYQTVEAFDAANQVPMDSVYKRAFAALLMVFTGGHPGCMVRILQEDYGIPIEDVLANEPHYYTSIVRPVIQKIYQNIPGTLQRVIRALSAFRIYNFPLLKTLIDSDLVHASETAGQLAQKLTAAYLVKREEGFLRDSIMRRLCAIEFREDVEAESFREFCGRAPKIYKHYLRENDYHAHSVALEGLYQELQGAYYCSERTVTDRAKLCEHFFAQDGILNTYLTILAEKRDAEDILANFRALLEHDWEFQFTLNFFLREKSDYTSGPYQRLCRHIAMFFEKRIKP